MKEKEIKSVCDCPFVSWKFEHRKLNQTKDQNVFFFCIYRLQTDRIKTVTENLLNL